MKSEEIGLAAINPNGICKANKITIVGDEYIEPQRITREWKLIPMLPNS